MGLSLSVTTVPVEPEPLDVGVDDHVLLTALNLGDTFEQTTKSSLRETPRELVHNSHSWYWLAGFEAALRESGNVEEADALYALLREVEQRGRVLVVAS